MSETLGGKVRIIRNARGESLAATALAIGTSKGHLSDIENGTAKNPSIELVKKIADHFGVGVDSLLNASSAPDEKSVRAYKLYQMARAMDDRDLLIIENLMETLRRPPPSNS